MRIGRRGWRRKDIEERMEKRGWRKEDREEPERNE